MPLRLSLGEEDMGNCWVIEQAQMVSKIMGVAGRFGQAVGEDCWELIGSQAIMSLTWN